MEDELKAKLAEAEKTIAELRAVKAVPPEALAETQSALLRVTGSLGLIVKGHANPKGPGHMQNYLHAVAVLEKANPYAKDITDVSGERDDALPPEARAVEAAEKIIATGIANGDHPKTIAMKIVSPPRQQQETELRTLTPAGIMRWVNESERKLSKDQTKVGAHTSDAPPVCPKCGSAEEMVRHGDGQWVCHATHVVERTCFPPGEGEEWAVEELLEAAQACEDNATDREGEVCIPWHAYNRLRAALKHAPARPTAAREDDKALGDRVHDVTADIHQYAADMPYERMCEIIMAFAKEERRSAAMQQGGKTP